MSVVGAGLTGRAIGNAIARLAGVRLRERAERLRMKALQ
jgi:hypothetical protein